MAPKTRISTPNANISERSVSVIAEGSILAKCKKFAFQSRGFCEPFVPPWFKIPGDQTIVWVSLSSRREGLLLRASHRTGHAGHASGSLD